MKRDKTISAFIALLRAGLWEESIQLLPFSPIDFDALFKLAEEQSVVGLIAAGLEHIADIRVTKQQVLPFMKKVFFLEKKNSEMNSFIKSIVRKLKEEGISSILLKGQGVAQCYERPLWRSAGDVDLFLKGDDYKKAVVVLQPQSSESKNGGCYSKEFALTIGGWLVELHGSLRTALSTRVDREVDTVQNETFLFNQVRTWRDGDKVVFLPDANNDVFFVFTHLIKHFYKEGKNLRQVCDLFRLLWSFRGEIDEEMLGERLNRAGLMAEWKAFSALAVDYLGVPSESIPFYCNEQSFHNKAKRIIRVYLNNKKSFFWKDYICKVRIFPRNAVLFSPGIFFNVTKMKIWERVFNR